MGRILTTDELPQVFKEIHDTSVVLVGGCFDILHIGHIRFLKESKKAGDTLVILLESDETVRKLKGKNRPYFNQKERAEMLVSLRAVDYVVLLSPAMNNQECTHIIQMITPDVIAVTENDSSIAIKEKHAKSVNARIEKIPYVVTHSTSTLATLLGVE